MHIFAIICRINSEIHAQQLALRVVTSQFNNGRWVNIWNWITAIIHNLCLVVRAEKELRGWIYGNTVNRSQLLCNLYSYS